MSKVRSNDNLIALNRKASFNYHLEREFDAGLVLQGWEVKSLRAGKGQLAESYVVVQRGEVFLLNAHIAPLGSVSTHIQAVPDRTRKLLLHRREIDKLVGLSEGKGRALVPLKLYWAANRVKLSFALALGKKHHDKREAEKEKTSERELRRLDKKVKLRGA